MASNIVAGADFNTVNMKPANSEVIPALWGQNIADNTGWLRDRFTSNKVGDDSSDDLMNTNAPKSAGAYVGYKYDAGFSEVEFFSIHRTFAPTEGGGGFMQGTLYVTVHEYDDTLIGTAAVYVGEQEVDAEQSMGSFTDTYDPSGLTPGQFYYFRLYGAGFVYNTATMTTTVGTMAYGVRDFAVFENI